MVDVSGIERRVLITGGAGGMGTAIAARFAAGGAKVILADRVPPREDTGNAWLECDVSDVSSIERLVEQVFREHGTPDVLINAAGLVIPETFGHVSAESWDLLFNVNARGAYFCSQLFAPKMSEQGGGVIINIASIAGRAVPQSYPAYSASKAALISITQQLAAALAPKAIRVNAVCPGFIDTPFNHVIDAEIGVKQQGLQPGEYLKNVVGKIPLRRAGTPEDIAAYVEFLASPQASFVTGQSVNIDGGIVLS
jgi:NAD(P)-dependent dehydrogenase (short-subunit alcohol dehydrogenase family)